MLGSLNVLSRIPKEKKSNRPFEGKNYLSIWLRSIYVCNKWECKTFGLIHFSLCLGCWVKMKTRVVSAARCYVTNCWKYSQLVFGSMDSWRENTATHSFDDFQDWLGSIFQDASLNASFFSIQVDGYTNIHTYVRKPAVAQCSLPP